MRKAIVILINFYQRYISIVIKQALGVKRMCKYSPTCSEYAKKVFQSEDLFDASLLSLRRIASCNPLTA